MNTLSHCYASRGAAIISYQVLGLPAAADSDDEEGLGGNPTTLYYLVIGAASAEAAIEHARSRAEQAVYNPTTGFCDPQRRPREATYVATSVYFMSARQMTTTTQEMAYLPLSHLEIIFCPESSKRSPREILAALQAHVTPIRSAAMPTPWLAEEGRREN